MCHKCDCAGKGLAAFLLGAIVGAAAGVLFAPAKGATTRRKLKRWADDTYEEQKEYVLEHAEDLKGRIKEHAADLKEKISPYMRPIYDSLYSLLSNDIISRYTEEGKIEVAPL